MDLVSPICILDNSDLMVLLDGFVADAKGKKVWLFNTMDEDQRLGVLRKFGSRVNYYGAQII
jgi:hypothetical protein